jgi:hypothetical protein
MVRKPSGGNFSGFTNPNLEQGPIAQNILFNLILSPWFGSLTASDSPREERERITFKDYAVHAKAQISIRLVNEALTEAELDWLEINKVEETGKAEPIEADEVEPEPAEAESVESAEPVATDSSPTNASPHESGDSPDEANSRTK